ncbi:MAG: FGGY family carbohydrate kinase [Acidimicrobiales bacterium]
MAKRALALDLGSSSVRAIVFEAGGTDGLHAVEGAAARRPRHLHTDHPGQATFDVDDYLADLVACIDELHGGGHLEGVTDLAVDCQWHSIVSLDQANRPTGELLSWADTRASGVPPRFLGGARWPEGAGPSSPGPSSRPGPSGQLRRPELAGPALREGDGPQEGPGGRSNRRGCQVGHHSDERLEQLRQRTGCAFAPMYWVWRAPWLAAGGGGPAARSWPRAAPGASGRGRGRGRTPVLFVGLAEYVGLRLLGDPSMSVSMASGTGLLATATRSWDAEALELAGLSVAHLPPLAPPGWEGRLAPEWRRRWPALAEAVWHPALGDGAAANLGVGCGGPDRAVMTVGTSAAVRSVRPAPDCSRLPAGLWRYCVDYESDVVGAAYSSGGQLYSWALSLWESTSTGATGTAAGAGSHAGAVSAEVRYDVDMPVGAGSGGVVVLPWHSGTRPPEPQVPGQRGCIIGLGLGHGGAHIVSAAAEAICFQLAGGLADLEAATGTGVPTGAAQSGAGAATRASGPAGADAPLAIVANGGAIERSPWWKQRLASTLGRPVHYPTAQETTARGAAAWALGVDVSSRLEDAERVEPVPEDVSVLAEARRLWTGWYKDLLPIAGDRAGDGQD